MSKPLRSYQKFFVEHCLESNQIVVLPTGAGKTLIGTHMIHEAIKRHPFKIAIFLAPTVALVNQQSQAIAEEYAQLNPEKPPLDIRTKSFAWIAAENSAREEGVVVVMTPQKFLNDLNDEEERQRQWLLQTLTDIAIDKVKPEGNNNNNVDNVNQAQAQGNLPKNGKVEKPIWSRCSLLVLDECHHAAKKHPYSLIMDKYQEADEKSKPRVVGLTASPAAHVTSTKIKERIKGICTKLCCKISVLLEDSAEMRELAEAVPIPEIQIRDLTKQEDPLDRLGQRLEERYKAAATRLSKSNGIVVDMFDATEIPEGEDDADAKEIINDAMEINDEDGEDVDDSLKELKLLLAKGNPEVTLPFLASQLIKTVGSEPALPLLQKMDIDDELMEIITALTGLTDVEPNRLQEVWNVMKKEAGKNPGQFSGILFVETRKIARCLTDKIKEKTLLDPEFKAAGFRPAMFIGFNNKKDVNRFTPSEQKQVMEKFRKQEYNLIVATSVAEEGIDIKTCNFVIRLTTTNLTPIKMIQSRGRARYPNSNYYCICGDQAEIGFIHAAMDGEKIMKETLQKFAVEDSQNEFFNFPTPQTSWNEPDEAEEEKQGEAAAAKSGANNSQPAFDPGVPAYKSKLNEYVLKKWNTTECLEYKKESKGKSHVSRWKATLTIRHGEFFQQTVSDEFNDAKTAEQHAAYKACLQLKIPIHIKAK